MHDLERHQRKLDREKQARKQAEALLEQKSLELYEANQALRQSAAELEQRVAERTRELAAANARLKRQAMEASLLHRSAAMAAEVDRFEDALQRVLDMVCDAVGWPVGDVYLPAHDGTGELVPTGIWHLGDRQDYSVFRNVTESMRFRPGVGLPGRILQSGEPAWIRNVNLDDNFPRNKVCADLRVKGAFGFPIKIDAQIVAVLEFFSDAEADPDEDLLRVMRSVGEQLGRVFERKRAEAEREGLNRQLLESSRRAGMAEVATNVLHNVGNVLNSVNVSAAVVVDKVRRSRAPDLTELGTLLQRPDDLGAFLTTDQKGRLVPRFVLELGRHMVEEQGAILAELESLTRNIDHIKDIVSAQQAYGKVSGVVEEVSLASLSDTALDVNRAALHRHRIKVVREYLNNPTVLVDKHKVLQILVNLLSNAMHALDGAPSENRRLTVRAAGGPPDRASIQVVDNGVGISAENLTRIFAYGFTTKKNGHGFGLHGSALAAREIGGTLSVESAGPGRGAMFTLDIPLRPAEVAS